MGIKRTKSTKKSLLIYKNNFGFRAPYQVLLDGNFIHTALKMLKEQKHSLNSFISLTFTAETRLYTTNCVLAELATLGPEFRATIAYIRQNIEIRKCKHYPPRPANECITGLIGDKNFHRLCIGTQDKPLRIDMRKIEATPLVYIDRSVMILEPPSLATLAGAKKV
jgi:U3 small nucleolar RNA-associated protein 23